MNIFELSEVSKTYGNRTVLQVPRLQMEEQKIYAILGPNGAGKTTLLRILNLLETPDKGRISFQGGEIEYGRRRLEAARQMCMVFQKPVMFRSSVFANVAYGLKVRNVGRKKSEAIVREALEFVGMNHLADHPAHHLSGGEAQRVALARALVLKPRVLLLDEPTANLDPSSVQHIEEIIRRWHREYGSTIILVTHNLFQAKRMAQECLIMMDGRIIEKGATEQIFSQPREALTSQFLNGSMVY
ncbi:MAG TPA: phosphate ABC transporter ATP-binding protein [Syntrophomonadaceae bacterium]|nr:phosphate ABC transporter ATP-binding protein [Syntrophomonadaceae bacterium]